MFEKLIGALVVAGVVAISLGAALASAQPVTQGARVSDAVRFDVSPAVRDLPPATVREGPLSIRRPLPVPPLRGTPAAPGIETTVQGILPAPKMPATLVNVAGLGTGFSGFTMTAAPSDDNIAVGPKHIVQTVNTMFAVFNKSGAIIGVPHDINTLWTGFGGLCELDNDGDVIVQYDRAADRWLITQFAVTGANPPPTGPSYLQCFAVSTTNDPTGTYFRYSFAYSTFPDYPKVGVWPDAYYVTYNMFVSDVGAFVAGEVCALDRAKMLAGQPATQQCFSDSNNAGFLAADVDGAMPPPAGAPNYVMSLMTFTSVGLWKFHVDWTTPANSTFTGPTSLTIPVFAQLCLECVPQPSPGETLDQLDDRLMYRLAYRNFGTHESLVTNHTVAAGTSAGVRWYEVRSPGTSPAIFQQGTYAPDTSYRFMGSTAMDRAGNMALGFSVSSATVFPSIHYAGRLAADPAGTMAQGEASIIDGTAAQGSNTFHRWGDYTSMRIDPSDDCTFWYTNQYPFAPTAAFNWATRIASFQFAPCGVAGATPVLLGIVSRKVHGTSGTFDLPLTFTTPPTINHAPTTEPRAGPPFQLVFTFDKPLSTATATVTEGVATPSSSIVGSTVVVDLTAVNDAQYVTVSLTNVGSTDGGSGGVAAARVGFLRGDVNASRLVAVTDLVVVNNQLGRPLTAANYVSDVNTSGIITVLDKVVVNNALGHFLPAP